VKKRLAAFAGKVRRIVRIFIGWKRMRFGFCPACNEDAPEVDRCPVCNYFSYMLEFHRPQTLNELKHAVWARFKRWLDDGDNLDDANASQVHAREKGLHT
jgi:hypothetical protein